jgi:hypothetical protein
MMIFSAGEKLCHHAPKKQGKHRDELSHYMPSPATSTAAVASLSLHYSVQSRSGLLANGGEVRSSSSACRYPEVKDVNLENELLIEAIRQAHLQQGA